MADQPQQLSIAEADAQVMAIERPHGNLFWLYLVRSLGATCLMPLVFLPFFFKYITLRYRIDEEGVNASWGLLFRRESYLPYKRIQDIHVNRGIIERWLGIGTVDIQTAAGSAGAELSIVGVEDYETVRDFLYRRMRGHGIGAGGTGESSGELGAVPDRVDEGAVIELLHGIREELVAVRRALGAASEPPGGQRAAEQEPSS